MEPYSGRTATTLVSDVKYLYAHYGESPAFFRTTAASRWSPTIGLRACSSCGRRVSGLQQGAVEASYWREAIDAIHALPEGGLVIADETGSEWVDGGHFDGLYSYAVLEPDGGDAYSWHAPSPDAWYVPGVNPGFSAVRIGYEASTYVPRRDGAAYQERWQAALDAGVKPALVAITTSTSGTRVPRLSPRQQEPRRWWTYLHRLWQADARWIPDTHPPMDRPVRGQDLARITPGSLPGGDQF